MWADPQSHQHDTFVDLGTCYLRFLQTLSDFPIVSGLQIFQNSLQGNVKVLSDTCYWHT